MAWPPFLLGYEHGIRVFIRTSCSVWSLAPCERQYSRFRPKRLHQSEFRFIDRLFELAEFAASCLASEMDAPINSASIICSFRMTLEGGTDHFFADGEHLPAVHGELYGPPGKEQ